MTGDAVLADGKRGFYAVADSPDRSPRAAWHLLRMMTRALDEQGLPGMEDDMDTVLIQSRNLVEKTFELIEPGNACTFTGIQVTGLGHQKGCVFMHTGDSMMYHFNRREGRLQNLTVKNFWLAGRVRNLYQCGSIMLEPGDLVMLVTDGFEEFNTCHEGGTPVEEVFRRERDVKRIMQQILHLDEQEAGSVDDIGMVLLDPFIPRDMERVILGADNDNTMIRGDN